MKKKHLLFLFTILLHFIIKAQNSDFYPNKIVIRFYPTNGISITKQKIVKNLENDLGIKVKRFQTMFKGHPENNLDTKSAFGLSCIYEMEIAEGEKLWQILKLLNQLPEVKYAEPIYRISLFETPNDPQLSSQYYLPLIKAFEAFEITHGDTNVVIGIVDTGVDFYHEDLQANYKYNYHDTINGIDDDMDGFIDNYRGWDFGDNDNNAQSEYNHHGTVVAGMASAVTNNGIGIAAIGYLTKLLPIKVMDDSGAMSTAYQGIVYAADHGCQIINCSWGGTTYSQLAADVVDYATNYKNCLVVAAAGNSKTDVSFYPASLNGVMSVAATDWADLKWSGSSFSINVDICAPGYKVRSTYQNNSYIDGSGTSFASPLVAGVAALVKAYRPELNPFQLAEQLRITSDIVDTLTDNQYFYHKMGYGRVNALRALSINTLPSIRIENIEFITNHSSTLLSGDTLQVSFSAINYLAQVTSCVIRLTSDSEYITPINNTINTGVLETMDEISYQKDPFTFKMSPLIPENFKAHFNFEMAAPNNDGINISNNYSDYQIVNCILNKTYIDIEPNKIATTLTSNGKIGYQDRSEKIGKGFIYNNQENLLNEGGIIIATDKDHMASALFNKTEFQTDASIDTFSFGSEQLEGNTRYHIQEDMNLPITIKQKTRAYKSDIWESSIIHEYTLINEAQNNLSDLLMSIFVDWDIDDPLLNEVSYNPDLNLFYTYTLSNQTLYTGLCLLTPGITLPYVFELVLGGNGGIDIMFDYTNEEKWFTMNNSRPNVGYLDDSLNVATQLTAGPYTINANDSVTLVWALIAAKNLYELTEIVGTLQEYYFVSNIEKLSVKKNWEIYPNPALSYLFIENKGLIPEFETLIYDSMGDLCKKIVTRERLIKLNTSELKSGIYFIQIKSGNESYAEKLIISN